MTWSCLPLQLHFSLHIRYLFSLNYTPPSVIVDTASKNTSRESYVHKIFTITCSKFASGHWCSLFLALFPLISEWPAAGQISDDIWRPTVVPSLPSFVPWKEDLHWLPYLDSLLSLFCWSALIISIAERLEYRKREVRVLPMLPLPRSSLAKPLFRQWPSFPTTTEHVGEGILFNTATAPAPQALANNTIIFICLFRLKGNN